MEHIAAGLQLCSSLKKEAPILYNIFQWLLLKFIGGKHDSQGFPYWWMGGVPTTLGENLHILLDLEKSPLPNFYPPANNFQVITQ